MKQASKQQQYTPKFGRINPLVVQVIMQRMQKLKAQRDLLLSADETKMLRQ